MHSIEFFVLGTMHQSLNAGPAKQAGRRTESDQTKSRRKHQLPDMTEGSEVSKIVLAAVAAAVADSSASLNGI